MGRKLIITGTKLTNLSAPRIAEIDKIESPGSLMLIDPTHPHNPWPAGLPSANGATLPNVLGKFATALAGPGTDVTQVAIKGWTGGEGLLERTAKGGIHGIISPTVATTATNFNLSLTDAAEAYVLANPTHKFYISTWRRDTKLDSPAGTTVQWYFTHSIGAGGNYLNYGRTDTIIGGTVRSTSRTLAPVISSGTWDKWTGGAPTQVNQLSTVMFPFGQNSFAYDSTIVRRSGARVYYRAYVEDLTVSGRTAEQVDAIDYALFSKEVLTPGGRYYGDTFTDPVTIP